MLILVSSSLSTGAIWQAILGSTPSLTLRSVKHWVICYVDILMLQLDAEASSVAMA